METSEHFNSNVVLSSMLIRFHPCAINNNSHTTIMLQNNSNKPVMWELQPIKQEITQSSEQNDEQQQQQQSQKDNENTKDTTNIENENNENKTNNNNNIDIFQFSQNSGCIYANSFQIIVVQFTPNEEKEYMSQFNLITNYNKNKKQIQNNNNDNNNNENANENENENNSDNSNNQIFSFFGNGVKPSVDISFKDKIFVKPTSIGMISSENISIQNTCEIPVQIQFEIPHCDSNIFDIHPTNYTLAINEKKDFALQFTPAEAIDYFSQLQCVYSTIDNQVLPFFSVPILFLFDSAQNHKQKKTEKNVKKKMVETINVEIEGTCIKSVVEFVPMSSDFQHIVNGKSCDKILKLQNTSNLTVKCKVFVESDNESIVTIGTPEIELEPQTRW